MEGSIFQAPVWGGSGPHGFCRNRTFHTLCYVYLGLCPERHRRWAHDRRVAGNRMLLGTREEPYLLECFGFVRNRQPAGATGTPTESLLDEYAAA